MEIQESLPPRGAWIEIKSDASSHNFRRVAPPRGERGLKF